jgi:hypothetical protein
MFPKSKLFSERAIVVSGWLETGAAGVSPETVVAVESPATGAVAAAVESVVAVYVL